MQKNIRVCSNLHNVIAAALDQFPVVGEHENGSAMPRFAFQPFRDEAHILPVKAAGGLIKNQYPAAGKDGAGDGKTLDTSEGVFQGRTVVIATGATPRPLGVPGEETLVGKGVHYCAACDGAPYRGKTVTVVGGGNSAAADALALSRIAKKVYLIHRRDSLRATKVYHAPLMNAPNVEFCWNSTVSALLHDSRLTGLRLKDVNTGAEHDLACDGVFVSVGRAPATELFRSELALDKSGYIIADESTRTNLPGVFAAGDVRTKALRQVVTAVSDGAVAVHYAEEYLAENR